VNRILTGSTTAIIVAGGRGVRLDSDTPKPLVKVGRLPMLAYSLHAFENCPEINHIVLVASRDWLPQARRLAHRWSPQKCTAVVPGGDERPDSVRAGLASLPAHSSKIAIHDAARPFINNGTIIATLEALQTHHGAVPGLPLADTLRKIGAQSAGGPTPLQSLGAADRSRFILTQTPQCFHREILEIAFQRATEDGFTGTDDASYVERLPGARIAVVPGDPDNFKITTPEDLERARRMVSRMRKPVYRVGEGYDAHRLVEGRPLILGGVTFPFEKGLQGHSDADVLCHAIGDALLGAAALGDLGAHFPDSDPQYQGISSLTLLERIADLVRSKGFEIANIDSTLILEKPKIAPYRDQMIANLSQALKIPSDRISVKATTTEGMGFEGRGEGVSCRAIVSIS
jgi:2-C-methyl-D-erythritol 2,4-cyclodiphosphate synthase/2-C-methyl-D-erythritol 4-phosphate cytidylyltransferase